MHAREHLNVTGAAQRDLPLAILDRFASIGFDKLSFWPGDVSEIFLNQLEGFFFVNSASNDQDRVVRLIIVAVESLEAFDGRPFDIRAFPNGGVAVIVPLK